MRWQVSNTITTYTPAEAAKLLKCSPDQVIALIKAERLGAVPTSIGKRRTRWVIPHAAIDAFLSPAIKPAKASSKPAPKATGKRWLRT